LTAAPLMKNSSRNGHVAARETEPKSEALRVIVADADRAEHAFYQETFAAHGHEACYALSGPHLVELCRLSRPDLVIAEVRLPGMDGISAAEEVCKERPTPFVLISHSFEPLSVARAMGNDHVLSCLTRPLTGGALGAAVAVARRRFERMEALRAEADAARQTLEDRKLIERAKGAVTRYTGVDEEEAYRRLRKLASESNRKLCEVAREVLASAEVFRGLDQSDGAQPARRRGD
jgi:two-component system, response regulator PdtaR